MSRIQDYMGYTSLKVGIQRIHKENQIELHTSPPSSLQNHITFCLTSFYCTFDTFPSHKEGNSTWKREHAETSKELVKKR